MKWERGEMELGVLGGSVNGGERRTETRKAASCHGYSQCRKINSVLHALSCHPSLQTPQCVFVSVCVCVCAGGGWVQGQVKS